MQFTPILDIIEILFSLCCCVLAPFYPLLLPILAIYGSHYYKYRQLRAGSIDKGWRIKFGRDWLNRHEFTHISTRNLILRDDFYLTPLSDASKDEIYNMFICSDFRKKHREGKV